MKKDKLQKTYGHYQKKSNAAVIILSVCLAVVMMLMCLLVFAHCNWSVEFNTENTKEVMHYKEPLKYPTAHLVGRYVCIKPVSMHVRPTHNVNTNQIGKHQIEYIAQKWGYRASLIQNITIVDTKAPVIELVYQDGHYTIPGEEYVEEGYRAFDEYDGDITDKVTAEQRDGIIVYFVKDSSGNVTVVERKIVYKDPVNPEISLIGEDKITLAYGDAFVDPGATATDNCDGDITSKIVVTGNVNTYVAGVYTILYEITDTYGNKASVARDVTVLEKKETPEETTPVASNGKKIYLTFDDGPGPYTEQLLDILKKHNVQATFFVVGKNCTPEILKRIVDEGHAIGLHSTNHTYSAIYRSEEAFVKDLLDMQKYVKDTTGVETFLLRFPGGSSNTVSKNYSIGIMKKLVKKVRELGFQYFDWNVDSGDAYLAKDKDTVFNNITKGVAPFTNSIVLQHDIKDFSVAAVEDVIVWATENGYTFSKLDLESPGAHHNPNN